ncbi:MAG: hypothetical protein ACR2HR_08020 [Euzebya sp.]
MRGLLPGPGGQDRAQTLADRVLQEDPYDEGAWTVALRSLLAQDRRAEVTT